jgi:uncharacterized protein (TIGR03066 family)
MGCALGALLLVAPTGFSADIANLVGKWEQREVPFGAKATVWEFTKEGNLVISVTLDDNRTEKVAEGTYKVVKDQLVTDLKNLKGKQENTITRRRIAKLTAQELVFQDEKLKEEVYRRLKE